jgi:hypothetical protein
MATEAWVSERKSDMTYNESLVDGFKNLDYPDKRKPYHGKKLRWTAHPYSLFAKILIGIAGDATADGDVVVMTRKFTKRGASKEYFLFVIETMLPEYPDWYFDQTGSRFTGEIAYHRYHKMTIKQIRGVKGSGRPGRSDEDYLKDPKCRPYVENVRRLWKRGTPISYEEAVRACSPKGMF